MCVCVCVCVCVHVCACMSVRMHACLCMRVCMHMCVCACVCMCESVCVCVCVCVSTCMCACVFVCMCWASCMHVSACMQALSLHLSSFPLLYFMPLYYLMDWKFSGYHTKQSTHMTLEVGVEESNRKLVSWHFEPSQPHRVTSGLKINFSFISCFMWK